MSSKDLDIRYRVSDIPVAPLLVIVGPTASGKTALAIEIAEMFDGEIICADSRTVYKGLDIGTAKPSAEEQERVPHYLLDVVNPDERFTVADFKHMANVAITDIRSRGKLPILVGGSGLYIDSVIFDYQFSNENVPRSSTNVRHLEKFDAADRAEMLPGILVFGLDVPREVLKQRITARVDAMIDVGFVDEVRMIRETYPTTKALDAPGYKAFNAYIDGALTIDEAKALFIKNDFQLARRQMTWFKRNLSIQWLIDPRKYVDTITTALNKLQ